MKYTSFLTVLILAGVKAASINVERIIGGELTTIDRYPAMCAVLETWDFAVYTQSCGGNILNSRSILSAAHCVIEDAALRHRVRVGSTWANSGGVVHAVSFAIIHPNLHLDADLVIFRLVTPLTFNNNVQMSSIAGPNYNVQDNAVVWAAGWGVQDQGVMSEQLRHVQVWKISLAACRERYSASSITDNMLCSGVLNVGGRDQCGGDSGGPLYHNGVLVGVCSWGVFCADPRYPGVNVRVSSFTSWIQANA